MTAPRSRVALLLVVLLIGVAPRSGAQLLYVTAESIGQLQQLDLSTSQITTLYSFPGRPDSLLVNAQGQIIYTVPPSGYVALYDPATGANTILASGLGRVRDMVFEPSGTTMLIGVYSAPNTKGGRIVRYDFVAGTVITVAKNFGGTVDGLAYDPAGELFAVINHNQICQIDPNTGAILNTLVLEPHHGVNGGDGMTYDPFTGQLWITHDGTLGNGLLEVPTDLSGFTLFQTGNIRAPDGIVSDGNGNLYIGAGPKIVVYNIPTDTITQKVKAKSADDVALVPQPPKP